MCRCAAYLLRAGQMQMQSTGVAFVSRQAFQLACSPSAACMPATAGSLSASRWREGKGKGGVEGGAVGGLFLGRGAISTRQGQAHTASRTMSSTRGARRAGGSLPTVRGERAAAMRCSALPWHGVNNTRVWPGGTIGLPACSSSRERGCGFEASGDQAIGWHGDALNGGQAARPLWGHSIVCPARDWQWPPAGRVASDWRTTGEQQKAKQEKKA